MKVVIVGGGLVGALDAIYFAQRGEDVEIYEQREDIRKTPEARGRSINLALSERGLAALRRVGLEKEVTGMMLPMRGRMLHGVDGSLTMSPYGVFGEAINSISRRKLNELLLDKAQSYSRVKLFFQHDLDHADLEKGELTFRKKSAAQTVLVKADLIVGADGAYSTVRRDLMRRVRMNYAQEYIEHGYMELSIPAKADGTFAMDSQSLHIWPRRSFMMIALPNMDGTFTLTLFMPFTKFESIKTEPELLDFFTAEFPDSIPLIGWEQLVSMFFGNPVGPLISVKCSPYHYKNRVVILGDASHAMVPFYGQGMNCGFEDCLVLDRLLYGDELPTENGSSASSDKRLDVGAALEAYTQERHPDAVAICDLAMHNYEEMRSNVLDLSYRVRKHVEGTLHYLFPRLVIPLYTMVSFTTIPYSRVVRRWKRQTWFLLGMSGFAAGSSVAALLWFVGGAMRVRAKSPSLPVSTLPSANMSISWVGKAADMTASLWNRAVAYIPSTTFKS